MQNKPNPFVNLIHQVQQGDQLAEANLWQELCPQLEKMVRHVVRFGPGRSVVDQKIVREVAQVVGEQDEDSVISVVTRRLFQDMYGRLQPRGRLETQKTPVLRDAPTRRERVGALAIA